MIKIHLPYYFLMVVALVIFVSCKKDNTQIPTISVTTAKKISFPKEGSTQSFSITSNAAWTIVNAKNTQSFLFYKLSATSGNKDNTITVTASANTYPYIRYDTLYIISGSVLDTIFIEQAPVTTSGILLVSFKNLYYSAGVDSIISADIIISENGVLKTLSNLLIDGTDNASFRSDAISIPANSRVVAAVFKNTNGKIRNWWNWNVGELLPIAVDINDSKYSFSGGDGTATTPYIISNPSQINNLRKSYHTGKFIKQDRDIDFADAIGLARNNEDFDFTKSDTQAIFYNNKTGWIPIGIAQGGLPFKGNYDGDFFKIKNLFMNRTSTANSSQVTALFGVVAGGTIQKVVIDNSSLLLGTNSVGSIVGNLQTGIVKNCANYAMVKGVQFVGGIVGSMNGGSVENSFNRGNIMATNSYVGGLVGGMYDDAKIDNCYNNAAVGGNWFIGGLLGYGAGNRCAISNSYNAGTLSTFIATNTNAIGGVVGGMFKEVSPITFTNCYFLKEGIINNINGVGGNPTTTGIIPASTSVLTGINFGTNWKIDNGENSGFPILNWQ